MKLLIDSDVVFDVFQRRQPHYNASNAVLKIARRGTVAGAVASHTLANLFYMHGKPSLPFIGESLLPYIGVCAGDAHQTGVAMRAGMGDFEDALQAAAALEWKAAFIVTRNTKHYRKSPIPAITPKAWLNRFAPEITT